MRMAREASTASTVGFVFQLKAEGHEEGEDTFEERVPIAKQLEVGRFAPEIDGDGAVFAGLAGSVVHGYPSVIRSRKLRRNHGGNALKFQGHREELRALPLKAMECGIFLPVPLSPWRSTTQSASATQAGTCMKARNRSLR